MTPLPSVCPRPEIRLPAPSGRWLAKGLLPACLAAVHFAASAANAGADEAVVAMMPPPVAPITSFGIVVLTNTLSITPPGRLNLKNNTLIVLLTPYPTVLGYVASGYDGGLWDGIGINSSTAASDPNHLTAVGIIDNAEAQYLEFAGRPLGPAAETIARYTYYGDSNLDGDVTLADYALFGMGTGWYHGDFNYDGVVDGADVALINASFHALNPGAQIPPLVPEPGTLSLLAAAVAGMAGRRRR